MPSPPPAYPGQLTVHRARGGGNLNVAFSWKGGEFEPDLSLVLALYANDFFFFGFCRV